MAMIAEMLKIDGARVADSLREARLKLNGVTGEVVLDFSSVSRLDPEALHTMEELAALTDAGAVTLAFRGASVDVYKVLKLVKLASRFNFLP